VGNLDPSINAGPYTAEEDDLLLCLVQVLRPIAGAELGVSSAASASTAALAAVSMSAEHAAAEAAVTFAAEAAEAAGAGVGGSTPVSEQRDDRATSGPSLDAAGVRWVHVARCMPGRTDASTRSRWSRLTKQKAKVGEGKPRVKSKPTLSLPAPTPRQILPPQQGRSKRAKLSAEHFQPVLRVVVAADIPK